MKVLHVCALLDATTGGGLAERTLQLARALAGTGTRSAILTLDIGLDSRRRDELAGLEVIAVPCIGRRFLVPWGGLVTVKRAVHAADLVQIMGHWTLLNAFAWLAARAGRKPYVFCPAGALAITGRSRVLKCLYNLIVGRPIVQHAAGHVAVTRGELPDFAAHGIAADRVTVIPNGVAVPVAAGDAATPELAERQWPQPFALFMGRLSYIKGPDLLLEAFSRIAVRFPELHLVMAGPDDGMAAGLRQFASRQGLAERVHLPGYLDARARESAYQGCQFLIVPSRKEAMSLVALEAGIRAKPVLLTDQCGFDEVAACGGGCVVTADADGLAAGLLALAADEGRCRQMGRSLQEYVRAHYAWNRAAELFVARFRPLAGGR